MSRRASRLIAALLAVIVAAPCNALETTAAGSYPPPRIDSGLALELALQQRLQLVADAAAAAVAQARASTDTPAPETAAEPLAPDAAAAVDDAGTPVDADAVAEAPVAVAAALVSSPPPDARQADAGGEGRAAPPADGSRRDPRWQQAEALLAAGRPTSAALQLLQLEAALPAPAADSSALLAIALYEAGVPRLAALALARSAEAGVDLRARARLTSARWHWQQGDAAATLAVLERLPKALEDRELLGEAGLLKGVALLASGDATAAITALLAAQVDPQRLLSATVDDRLRAGLIQYNLAIARLRAGERDAGLLLLDRIGRMPTTEPALAALRDQANLSLGWQFLREAQGATARPILERISLEGPYSNKALLGLGWAALAPQGERQRRATAEATTPIEERETPKFVLKALQRRGLLDCQEVNARSRAPSQLCESLTRYQQDRIPAAAEALLAKALLPWRTLRERDPRDPAVRESWTALPHVLARIGDRHQAGTLYEDAIARLSAALADNAAAQARLADGGASSLPGADADLPEPGARRAGETLLARDLALGVDALPERAAIDEALAAVDSSRWLIATAAAADPALDAVLAAQMERAVTLSRTALQQEQERLTRYLAAARAGYAEARDLPSTLRP